MINYASRMEKNKLTILLFHGVIEKQVKEVRNYNRKHLEANYFRQVILQLKKKGTAISMDDLIGYKNGEFTLPEYPFIITFDDGFANNLYVSAPILNELNVPATFYISTKFIEENAMSWIDRIELLIENTAEGELQLPWNNSAKSFSNKENKIELLDEIRKFVKSDKTINIDAFVTNLYNQLSTKEIFESRDPLDLKMNWKEVQKLDSNPLFTIGGHTHNHKILSFLSKEELNFEVNHCLKLIKNKGKIDTIHFSYPEGQVKHYNDDVIKKLKCNNIVCCPSAIDGVNPFKEDLFHLKRINVV